MIAHVGGVPVEETLLPLASGVGAGLLLARAWAVSHVRLPRRLIATAEAARRGTSVDRVAAELLAAQLPESGSERPPPGRHLSFAGVGASGGGEAVGRNHEEILRQAFASKTARDV